MQSGLSKSAVAKLERIWGHHLSQRELEVGRLAIGGRSTQEIAEALFISENTVKTHLRNLFRKTKTRSRNELYRRLVETGLTSSSASRERPSHLAEAEDGVGGFDRWFSETWAMGSTPVGTTVVLIRLQFLNGGLPRPQPQSMLLELLATSIRQRDHLFHWRDDLFLLALPGSDIPNALEVADRLIRKIRRWSTLKALTLHAWMGAASLEEGEGTPEGVVQAAEARLRPLHAEPDH